MTPRPPHPKVLKTAMGSAELVSLGGDEDQLPTLETVLALKSRNVTVYGVETTDNATTLWDVIIPNENVAYVFGNELIGVGKLLKAMLRVVCDMLITSNSKQTTTINLLSDIEVLRECDEIISLPTFGVKNSLNIANCVSVVLWDTLRRWRSKGNTSQIP